jgi:hypothetical protein
MRTEIKRKYKWGFHLTEQELRRIVQAVTEHAEKASAGVAHALLLRATLKDGSIIESSQPDDIFSIENAGAKRIEKIEVSETPKSPETSWRIAVTYQDGAANSKSWDSIDFQIAGESRDWAFVTASDIEDRVKRTKVISWDAIFGSKWSVTATMMIGMILMILLLPMFALDRKTHIILQQQYDAGTIKDPIQALILIEQARNEQSGIRIFWPILVSFALPLVVFEVGSKLLPLVSPSYNFYWGDYIAIYDRRRQRKTILWTVIVLGLVVSIIAGIITKKLGF